MAERKIFAGGKLRSLREQHRLTQAELAVRLGVSTSYVNQIENNQRPLTAGMMLALAHGFNLDLADLGEDNSGRLLAALREAMADPAFGEAAPGLQDLKTLTYSSPDIARAILRLYEVYRKATERLTSLDDVLARQPASALQSPYEEVRDFFHYANNYIDPLDRAAETLAQTLGMERHDKLRRLAAHLQKAHGVTLERSDALPADLMRSYDAAARQLVINDRLDPPTQYFQIACQLALIEQSGLIENILDAADFKTEDAERICRLGLANYFAGALQMPYGVFLEAAARLRHDLDELSHAFGASFEQVAHRLSTLQRPKAAGVPFFFARVDRAGTITKRHSAAPLQFARFGGACPLWNVHRAFEERGQIIRQLAETPDGKRYLCLAWAAEKRSGGFNAPVRRYAYALGCEITHAGALVYADGMPLAVPAAYEPIGVSCRICERRNCPQRSMPPLAAGITVPADRRSTVPYEIN
jgi:predicted transcriptional regulator/DNA-binding XRE family transcriptional regulator